MDLSVLIEKKKLISKSNFFNIIKLQNAKNTFFRDRFLSMFLRKGEYIDFQDYLIAISNILKSDIESKAKCNFFFKPTKELNAMPNHNFIKPQIDLYQIYLIHSNRFTNISF